LQGTKKFTPFREFSQNHYQTVENTRQADERPIVPVRQADDTSVPSCGAT
jgi:hypothetical protein